MYNALPEACLNIQAHTRWNSGGQDSKQCCSQLAMHQPLVDLVAQFRGVNFVLWALFRRPSRQKLAVQEPEGVSVEGGPCPDRLHRCSCKIGAGTGGGSCCTQGQNISRPEQMGRTKKKTWSALEKDDSAGTSAGLASQGLSQDACPDIPFK